MFVLRLISWIVLVALFFAAMFLKEAGRYILLIMFVFGTLIATYETINMLERIEYKGFKKTCAIFNALSVVFIFIFPAKYNLIPLALLVMLSWGNLLVCGDKENALKKISVSLGGSLLALLPIFFLSKIYYYDNHNVFVGVKLLLYLVVITKSGDTFAYITGMLSNKILKGKNHKIVPSISPKKSWEGTIGGMICSVIISCFLYNYLFYEKSLLVPVMTGILLFWGCFFGDLSESALKRTCGVKDSGNILPGMGGVCDLLDSFTFNAPVFYFCIIYFL